MKTPGPRGLSYGADALNLRAVGDLLVGRYGRSHMVTLVERRSRLPAGSPAALRHDPHRGRRGHSSVPAATANHALIPDLGPRRRNDPPRRLHRRHRHPGLLLRPTAPGSAAATSSNGLLRRYFPKKTDLSNTTPITSMPWSTSSTSTSRGPGMANSSRGLLGRHRCDDRLKPQPPGSVFSCR